METSKLTKAAALAVSVLLQYGTPAAAAVYTAPDCSQEPLASNGICDLTASPADRAAALVAALSAEDKVDMLVSDSLGAAEVGLPAYNWWNEALHGVAASPGSQFSGEAPFDAATSFPMPLLMASAFDDELIERVGSVIGREARAFGNGGWAGVDYWTPNVNAFKDPRWGRGSETPGEDALQISRYARAIVHGLQGNEDELQIVATCKHYAVNDFENWGGQSRHDFDAKVNEQDLAEYYLRPFQECARDAKAGSIMCSYNAVNGVPACANSYLLGTVLREHWNWTEHSQYVTSDCGAVQDIWQNHHYTETNAEGAAVAFENGCDLSCEYTTTSDVSDAHEQGLLTEEMMDRALLRLYETLIRTGFFDGSDATYASLGWGDVNNDEAQEVAYQAAVEGVVLLKNDGTLPLDLEEGASVAMIGFWADDESKLQGGYSGNAPFLHTPAYAAENAGFTVYTASGPTLEDGSADDWTQDALDAADQADYILYFGGLDTSAAGEERDREEIDWPEAQLDLLDELSQLGKPLVVIQMGDQVDNTPLLKNDAIGGILWASYPGQDGGPAVVDLITGVKAPAGRLCVTQYPSNYTDAVDMTDMTLRPSETNPGRTYRWYSTPVAPYGFGLHYTTFEAAFDQAPVKIDIQEALDGCTAQYPDTCPLPPLQIQISNTGERASDFVSLVFIKGEVGPKPYPLKTLVAYGRSKDIAPGKNATIELDWTLESVSRREKNGDLVIQPGKYTLLLDEPTQAKLDVELVGERVTLDKWPKIPSTDE
ncbi:putative exo-1,4-beta-xylosidase bxlB [Aspergillus lucknowensis]|uniref:xylan 1,4-beta-xylosidase n=1 Tax=Aspergillus lucknowensis TaxID=176173 RepID=A0ABR4LNE2_9EURO